MIKKIWICLLLVGCAGTIDMESLSMREIKSGKYTIATWVKIQDQTSPIHIYIEGDGHAFNGYGRPTGNPTPRSTFVRDLAKSDIANNVVYMARPCQFIMSESCSVSDWTSGRFSVDIINSVVGAIKQIAGNRPIVLIGYSGGAMVSGLVIQKFPELNVKQWVTIAGVLNHHDWTEYFDDKPLTNSLDLDKLPNVSQIHYVGGRDRVVPVELSQKWTQNQNIVVQDAANHDDFKNLHIDFLK